MVAGEMKFYMSPMSPASQAVWLVLKELNVQVDIQKIDILKGEQTKEPFLRVNPTSTIPVLDDNGLILTESRAIMVYLVEKYSGGELFPADPQVRGKILRWMAFDQGVLYPLVMKAIGGPRLQGKPTAAKDLEELTQKLDLIEQKLLCPGSPFLAGDDLTLADMSLCACLTFLDFTKFELSRWPKLQEWRGNVPRRLPFLADLIKEGAQIIEVIPAAK